MSDEFFAHVDPVTADSPFGEAKLPQLGALLENLQTMKVDPTAPDPNDALIVELLSLERVLVALPDHREAVTARLTTGSGAKRCRACGRPY